MVSVHRRDVDSVDCAEYPYSSKLSELGKPGNQFFGNKKNLPFRLQRRILPILLGMLLFFPADLVAEADAIDWKTDYRQAVQTAKESAKNLLIYFYAEVDSPKLLDISEERFVQSNGKEIRQVVYYNPQSMQQPLSIAAACREF